MQVEVFDCVVSAWAWPRSGRGPLLLQAGPSQSPLALPGQHSANRSPPSCWVRTPSRPAPRVLHVAICSNLTLKEAISMRAPLQRQQLSPGGAHPRHTPSTCEPRAPQPSCLLCWDISHGSRLHCRSWAGPASRNVTL